jgi:hypothetical protein
MAEFSTSLGRSISIVKSIFVPKGMFVAFVVSSQYISLHPDIQTYRHTSADSKTQIHS